MPFNFDWDRLLSSPFFVGAAGALVALKSAPGKTWIERAFNLACGMLLAGFLSAAVAEWLGLKTPETQLAAAFLVGLFGMNVVAAANVWFNETKLADVIPWFKKG